ncbi:MAG: trypsin-like peptidase domain-containing protein, partial [Anaerolineae bacterium]
MGQDLRACVIQIHDANDVVWGSGFVLSDEVAVTCAHVVEDAGAGPGELVSVAFVQAGESCLAEASADAWRPSDSGDVAILSLQGQLPDGVRPAVLASSEATQGHAFRALGYPEIGDLQGLWAEGKILGPVTDAQGTAMLQLDSQQVAEGMSGAPVLDIQTDRAVGMLTETYVPDETLKFRDAAFATPTETIKRVWPALQLTPSVSRRPPPFVLPQVDVSTFTGRAKELDRLEDLLEREDKVCSIMGLAGAGGIGKSALACHFATLYQTRFPDGVIGLRVDGKDIDTIAREFARCCGEVIQPEDERDASTIMQDLFRHRRALLIFDNADDDAIRALRPGGNRCAVIITTRDRSLPALLDVPAEGQIDLSPLPDPDSVRLLERLLGEERVAAERGATERIIALVGNLPLALQIVGAALHMQPWRKLADYGDSLNLVKLKIRG